jgi:iron-sulfur cluster assembly accessory protein
MTASKVSLEGIGAITVTEGAEKFMRRMVRFGGLGPGAGFRLTVSPGGCSGLSADFTIEDAAKAGDVTLVVHGFKIFLPEASARLLAGVTIDFGDTATQQGLSFVNPNAGPSCSTAARPPMVKLSDVVRR